MSNVLAGKVAVVTGASKGIGAAIAAAFAREGAQVAVSSRKQEGVDQVAAAIRAEGGEAFALAAHMGEMDQVLNLTRATVERWGRIDIAVNNAATNPHFGPLLTADEGQLAKILDVNLMGYFRLCKVVEPHMREQGGGKIINLASVAGLRPATFMGGYGISKAGVLMMTQVLAVELGPANIQVNAIAPGLIRTKFSRALWENEALVERVEGYTPLGRLGEVEDVVGAALFLASPASDYVTGDVIVVDGGTSLPSGL
ncbi:MAG: glucose 1-dehydrogenase [Anaerolineales bacterium]|jgi:NAD(P)-dependent dehydrogenase (short-subunit alcohol dehydrogenase family)